GARAVPSLQGLLQDKDSDVRLEAMHGLVLTSSDWARRLAPQYRKMLRGHDLVEQVDAMWRLVRFRDPEAVGTLKEMAETDTQPGIRNNARVASLVLEGAEDDL